MNLHEFRTQTQKEGAWGKQITLLFCGQNQQEGNARKKNLFPPFDTSTIVNQEQKKCSNFLCLLLSWRFRPQTKTNLTWLRRNFFFVQSRYIFFEGKIVKQKCSHFLYFPRLAQARKKKKQLEYDCVVDCQKWAKVWSTEKLSGNRFAFQLWGCFSFIVFLLTVCVYFSSPPRTFTETCCTGKSGGGHQVHNHRKERKNKKYVKCCRPWYVIAFALVGC